LSTSDQSSRYRSDGSEDSDGFGFSQGSVDDISEEEVKGKKDALVWRLEVGCSAQDNCG
jgi:hypothetical protein